MQRDNLKYSEIKVNIIDALNKGDLPDGDKDVFDKLSIYLENNKKASKSWKELDTFWPPRLIDAYRNDELMVFFGAGLSMPSGLKSWGGLLDGFPIPARIKSLEELKNDPLTHAELVSHQIGNERLQTLLRQTFEDVKNPSLNHFLLAALELPFYLTSNYDCLFEEAWKKLHPEDSLEVITCMADLGKIGFVSNDKIDKNFSLKNKSKSYLIKIHGSIDSSDSENHLILTRSDYRIHYRNNLVFFEFIKYLMLKLHTLFIGFSHNDPEVARLIDDVIWLYEKSGRKHADQPNIYGLQFDMLSHTPEIFAARGLVALEPPSEFETKSKSLSLVISLCDICAAYENELDKETTLDDDLDQFKDLLSSEIGRVFTNIEKENNKALEFLDGIHNDVAWLETLYTNNKDVCNQGVFLLDRKGRVKACKHGGDVKKIDVGVNLSTRFYFKESKTYKVKMLSNSDRSHSNGMSTFFLCSPVLGNSGEFSGLLFGACQIGKWIKPYNFAKNYWDDDVSVLLIDRNGVCLLPPNNEFDLDAGTNSYSFDKLFKLSKRDKLISRIMENIVPINKDDDVISFDEDLKVYSVISELDENSRWKIGLSKTIELK